MPDQSSAASEHAILQEITAPLETLPDDPVAMAHADFPSALRGYDRPAVDAYVQQISQMVAELHATRSPEAAVRRALERVGEQISGILQRAHETAEQITGQSRGEAEDRLEQARGEAAEIIAAAEQRVRDLDADTDRIWIERGRIIDDARDLARQLLSVADTAADAFPEPEAPAAEPYDDPGSQSASADHDSAGDERGRDRPREDADELDRQDELEGRHDLTTHVHIDDDEPEDAGHDEPEPAPVEQTPLYDDVGATVRYDPLQLEPDEVAGEDGEPVEPQVRGTRAAIPPASEAAHRRPETR
ncbi:MAG: DivIVA domain-containing protein [Actinomycetota bacterium]|nr:DivIVA domain-containing protein [Actinomycetota bacterium]